MKLVTRQYADSRLVSITWRLVWPGWKLIGKLLLHPCVDAIWSIYIGLWSVLISWLHQGSALAGHISFSRKHGFTWYAVKDPGALCPPIQGGGGEAP